MAESDPPKPKQRPLVRLAILLISHSLLVSVVCCVAGVVALLLLPLLAKKTYISENALMPGSASSMLSNREIIDAGRLVKDIVSLELNNGDAGMKSQILIAEYMSDLGAEVSFHNFHPLPKQFNPLHFFSSPDFGTLKENFSCSLQGINTVGIIRAPRGDGKEAIVLVTPYNSKKVSMNEALSLGIAYSVFSLLSQVTWLAKDIIWLVADSKYGEYTTVEAWLRDYYAPVFSGLGAGSIKTCYENSEFNKRRENQITEQKVSDSFKRAGTMAAALVIKVADKIEPFGDTLNIYAEASNGQMPNLDLINIVNYLAVHRQGLYVKVEKLWSLFESKLLNILGEILEFVGNVARSINPEWKFGIPAADYVEGTATLASSLYYQALGIPTGPHGAFRDYQIDAITLEFSPSRVKQSDFLLRGGRLIEGVVRSVNNLLEKFHQSFFLYLLTSSSKFVSVGVYMIAFTLLIAPLPVVAASLYSGSSNLDPSLKTKKPGSSSAKSNDELGVGPRSWKWLNAAKNVFVVHLWGSLVSSLPYFICQIFHGTATYSLLIWFFLSVLLLITLYLVLGSPFSHAKVSEAQRGEWAILKSTTISAAFIGLALMSVINFATAEIGALLIVPLCLLAHPLKLDVKAGRASTFVRAASNLVIGFIGFPPVAFFIFKGAFGGSNSVNIGDFWTWVESLWSWNSATYLYIGMVHLPCWVLCIHILLYPC